jgi:hypothetical protein
MKTKLLTLVGLMLAAALSMGAGCGIQLPDWPPKPSPTPPPPTTLATPTPSPSPSATPTATPSPTPSVPPTPPPPTPTPVPTPSPCVPVSGKVCVTSDGDIFPFDRTKCWTCADWQGYMIRNGYFTAGDPKEDGDVGGRPGYWLNYDPQGVLVGVISKRDCTNGSGALVVDWPRAEERVVPCPTPQPTPSATPPPVPTPSPGSGGCPGLLKVGGMFLSAVDCGQQCRKQGYLGVRVNVTATELCREGDPGCVCDPARNRCEMPRVCQNSRGATTYISLPGHFAYDICDANSDNPFNCHHKPKANEAGVTTFTYCPAGAAAADPRCTSKCVDVREVGTREVACPRVSDSLDDVQRALASSALWWTSRRSEGRVFNDPPAAVGGRTSFR